MRTEEIKACSSMAVSLPNEIIQAINYEDGEFVIPSGNNVAVTVSSLWYHASSAANKNVP